MQSKVCMRDSYKMYKESVQNPLKLNDYLDIIHEFIKFIMKKVMNGFEVNLGARLGYIGIKGKKAKPVINDEGVIKGLPPNWAKTKELWKKNADDMGITFEEYVAKVPKEQRQLVYCFNEHSNGNIYNINWYKKNVLIANKVFYSMRFSRDNKRTLSKLVIEGAEYKIGE